MNPYHLFGGHDYYPGRGTEDYRGSFATLAEAIAEGDAWVEAKSFQWAVVLTVDPEDDLLTEAWSRESR